MASDQEFEILRTNRNYDSKSDILCRMGGQKKEYEHVQKISGSCIWEFRVTENLIRGESNIKPRGPITFNIWPASWRTPKLFTKWKGNGRRTV